MKNVLKTVLLISAFIVLIAFIVFVLLNRFMVLIAMPVVLVVLAVLDWAAYLIASAGSRGRKVSIAAIHAVIAGGVMVLAVIVGIGMLISGGSSPKPSDAFISTIILYGAVPDIALTLAADYLLWRLGQRNTAKEEIITEEGEQ